MSEHHFLEAYLMRDVIRDMQLTDILLQRVKPVPTLTYMADALKREAEMLRDRYNNSSPQVQQKWAKKFKQFKLYLEGLEDNHDRNT